MCLLFSFFKFQAPKSASLLDIELEETKAESVSVSKHLGSKNKWVFSPWATSWQLEPKVLVQDEHT